MRTLRFFGFEQFCVASLRTVGWEDSRSRSRAWTCWGDEGLARVDDEVCVTVGHRTPSGAVSLYLSMVMGQGRHGNRGMLP